MMLMLIFMLFFFVSNFIMLMSMLVSKKIKMNFEKMSPFECGFNPMKYKRMPFSMRFFLITIIFLIFDVEIAILLPMILNLKKSYYISWMMTIMLFITILIIGLSYEWKKNALNWI